ncbi:nickel pincer cofactor biosynthesis protein LarC [Methanoregula sp.]|uniref:nickel pincer cofactor biosynthesis protein LarC n=1 Tax=Methanoregula sp. TaxID=2052170 RepID=UPI002BD06B40|nr:nickel pincer cofactor biosynthesis protein LarC [Methanoregula sp.]HVP95658.1 nickel pincer cofactor biosynthesis protein LarC [Methanoregula sp.]
MQVLVLDPFHGAAGDMITGALLACGADREAVVAAMRAVVAEPAVETVTRAGIRATKVRTHATPVHRTFADVEKKLDGAAPHVPAGALAMARRVFARINAAEESVHGEHVHFHEVGADDAIADVVGACTALYTLGVAGVVIHPIALGSGTITGSHGTIPVPAPATAAILEKSGLAAFPGSDTGELCTPTGAAILAEFAASLPATLGTYTILATGYGAGTKDPKNVPNVLRAMVVESTDLPLTQDTVDLLETNVDDVSGEIIGEALARFMAAGARDASAIPILMKKGRPGYLVTVITSPASSADLARLMACELGTLGVRCIPAVHRFVADRTTGTVEVTIAGHTKSIPVKYGWMDGRCYTAKPEFDAAKDWAAELGLPVREVLMAISDTLETRGNAGGQSDQ